MIRVEVFDDHLRWKKKIKKTNIFFNKVLNLFPKKYKFKNKNIIFPYYCQTIKKLRN